MTTLAELTTMRVGGEAHLLLAPATADELVEATLDAWGSGEAWMLLGGGSNMVVADEGFDGTVIRVLTRGIEQLSEENGRVRLRVEAGEPWDALVEYTVQNGLTGIEALSGIPGSSGAAPVQNIGAYGQEISTSLVAIDFLDYLSGERQRITAADLGFDYRTSVLKQGKQGLVLAIELELGRSTDGLGAPVAYAQLASSLGVTLGDRVPLALVRDTVLALRSSKGMVLDPADPDSVSCGSFFTNPIVGENFARTLPEQAPRWANAPEPSSVAVPLGEEPAAPPVQTDFRVKLSAAWLIEKAGITRGFSLPGSRAAISTKHTLAIVNTGGATAAEVAELGRYVQTRVFSEFGVRMHAEPVLVGVSL
ncbi:UDP-N-acetylmuramate dehydrogenase [Conyzicola lurida]|uniref:UDP-N-acetylenolpyruvoylglucosamine reductase n=1 Tax=Conyzicola lurida TaxID=1172621 RepID=A0A841ARG4_9MICO|nr:UDP-N-acetylmuramate dehydrogenase [Conyzicola lurida]MBB5844532.1 UDP-N-acetylmuramate dehydrogenase [Conyzicola lurida]